MFADVYFGDHRSVQARDLVTFLNSSSPGASFGHHDGVLAHLFVIALVSRPLFR